LRDLEALPHIFEPRNAIARIAVDDGKATLATTIGGDASMSKVLKIAAAAALLASGATLALAQAQNPSGDPRPLAPSGGDSPVVRDQKAAPTNPPKAAPAEGSGSRAIGPPGNEMPAPGATKDTKKLPKSPD
jgi:hypothetical protein